MARAFLKLRLDKDMCIGLREAIRPGVQEDIAHSSRVEEFCRRLYLAHYSLEADPDMSMVDFVVEAHEIMIINNFVSVEDGAWAKDVLHQTRQVLYELNTGHEAVRLASSKDASQLLKGMTLDPDKEPSLDEPTSEPEGEKA